MPKRPRASDEHLQLFPVSRPPWETHGIFSEHFLKTRLDQVESWPKRDDDIRLSYESLLDLWHRRHVGFEKGNEETTCREFLEPVLQKLGFSCLYKEDLPVSLARRTPDYLLFADEKAKDEVFNVELRAKYQAAIGLLEAKKVDHPLDRVSESEARFPHQQVREYLDSATDEVGRPYFRWGILTNGNFWRLYCRDAHPGAYFEFHLAGPLTNFCSFGEFKTFLSLFQSSVFVETDGVCLLDQIRNGSIQFQAELEESIRRRVGVVVQDLANGFWSFKENKLAEDDLRGLYDKCLILLYRLLFVLYAEGRALLPVKLSGAGSNVNYRDRYSLNRLVHKLQSPAEFQADNFTDLYEDLLKLFHLINGDRPSANKACGVPLYNGGLFDGKAHPELEKWRIGDKSLANVLRDLIFSAGSAQRAKQREFEWGTIDYADLEVRQLGDIYEGLLGGHLEISHEANHDNELQVMGEHAALQESGTFYTPDWVVRFLIEKTLRPLIDRIDRTEPVKDARKKDLKDNSFANEVLKLDVLDPAMGSGHFLVRATEWLADEIVYHPTTQFRIEKVSPGLSQEQAEISYWRRRVVEACIYGVDLNPLAVELAKLSLWLTCIASEEPLNFLDHHLRPGNSLIGAKVAELSLLPQEISAEQEEGSQIPLSIGTDFSGAIMPAIREITAIETEISDKLEVVKDKERRWVEQVMGKLQPFKQVANLWTATVAGLPVTQFDYYQIGRLILINHAASAKSRQELAAALKPFQTEFAEIVENIKPLHWELEFPDVFYAESGKPRTNQGFDAIIGNPPYISTQTSSDFRYRETLEQRFGFADDLYVHFVDQGFKLLKREGRFGFIISDTFFTLASKLRLRELLQSHQLDYLVQCDPFRATVDAAMFVVERLAGKTKNSGLTTFIQARYPSKNSEPETDIPKLFGAEPEYDEDATGFRSNGKSFKVWHASKGCLRLHRTYIEPYRRALKCCFFEPREGIIRLYNRFNEPLKALVDGWWDKVDSSKKFTKNRTKILSYQRELRPGDITLIGLISEGGQGMRTGNNGRFLGYLSGTPQAKEVLERRRELQQKWERHARIGPALKGLLDELSGDIESAIDALKERSDLIQFLDLHRGEVYRIVPLDRVAQTEDFLKAFEYRRQELEEHWAKAKRISDYYLQFRKECDGDFFKVFDRLLDEASRESFAFEALGLKSGELYNDVDGAPRIATIFNGLIGERTWVPFRKGDPEGHKWTTAESLMVNWDRPNVLHLQTATEARWQGHSFFFLPGATWTLHANHVALKARLQPPCVFDASGSRLTPTGRPLSTNQFLAILNADIFSFIVKKFIKNTQDYEVNDLRMAPIVVPTHSQGKELEDLCTWAIKAKTMSLAGSEPTVDLVRFCQTLGEKQRAGPEYLRPDPQMLLLHTADDCLAVIELAVNWAVERLYGVEGLGPFNEF